MNEVVTQAVCDVHRLDYPIHVVHLAGRDDEAAVRQAYDEAGVPSDVHAFAHDMSKVYRDRDVALCRAGAATCAELSAFGVPALMIPYPYAANDHQTANARAMEKIGAAHVVPEEDLSVPWLKDYIVECLNNPERLRRMHDASVSRATGRGAEALADLLVASAGNGDPAAVGSP